MGAFLGLLLLVWLVSAGVYVLLNKRMKSSDLKQLRDRLTEKSGKKKKEKEKPQAALISPVVTDKGQILTQALRKYKFADKVQTLIEQAGVKWTVPQFARMSMGAFLGVYALGYLLLPGDRRLLLLLPAAGAAMVPYLMLLKKKAARLKRWEELFPDVLEFVSRSMRAGHAFSVSLEMIHKEFPEPIASEFRRTFEEQNLGMPLDSALLKLSQRITSLDVQFFTSAVTLQKRTGGNLAEILDKLATIMRERFKLRAKIQAISAHGRMTGTALSCIPIGTAVLMFFSNPDYVAFFFEDEIGHMMAGAAVVLQILGYAVMQKIVKIDI